MRGARGAGDKGEGMKEYRSAATQQSQDVKCGTRNRVSNIVITMFGVRWIRNLPGL